LDTTVALPKKYKGVAMIQLFVPKFRVDEVLINIRECLEKGWTGLGFKTVEFEEAWKDYIGLPHAHFISSNTVGLHLALSMFKTKHGWRDHDEVITTPLTFISTNHAISYVNLKPVFADVDEYLCLNPESVESLITQKTRAILFVGMAGSIGQYHRIADICREHKLKLILDAAHMAGTRYKGQHIGKEADAVVYSFQAVKNLPTADSGMICFKEKKDDERVRKLSWLGIDKDTYTRTKQGGSYKWMYEIEEVGYKYHGNSIMASIALVSLKYLDQDNAYRRQIARWYRENLISCKNVTVIRDVPDSESATHLFQLLIANRDAVVLALHEHDIFPGVHYRDNTEYPMYRYAYGTCPYAAKISKNIISLPLHVNMTKKDVDIISALICKYAT
jgi:dTDP-4-amino-4,6-dideoxygalactose transaminase